jgi:tRNA dimethylallyltransferase
MPKVAEKYLVVIAGPTAVGKTALCINLAKQLQTDIISADSRQFFKELAIGTAKPTLDELGQVRHHFIDSHSIQEEYSAGDFERDAVALLEELYQKHDVVVMTGGSGLYIKAVCEGLDNLPQPLPGLRVRLTERLETEGLQKLQEEIKGFDPEFFNSTEINNPQRVVRALEVFYTTGTPISSYQQKNVASRPFVPILISLNRDRTELYDRINQRVDAMITDGLVEEAKSVMPFRDHHALKTVGYKEVYDYLGGNYDHAEMIRLIKQNTRRYAKRQMTWFRHQGAFQWFDATDEEGILNYIRTKMAE